LGMKQSLIGIALVFTFSLTECGALSTERPQLVVQSGHAGWVTAIAFSPSLSILATGGVDGSIALWDIKTGFRLGHVVGHSGPILSLRFCNSAGGTLLASLSMYTPKVMLWDLSLSVGHLVDSLDIQSPLSAVLLAPIAPISQGHCWRPVASTVFKYGT